jgi:hypothetical protein
MRLRVPASVTAPERRAAPECCAFTDPNGWIRAERIRTAAISILRAIASSDLHNLVYLSDYRIVPVVTVNRASPLDHGARAT